MEPKPGCCWVKDALVHARAWCRAGVEVGRVEVRFTGLTVTAPIGVGASGLPNVGNAYTNAFMVR